MARRAIGAPPKAVPRENPPRDDALGTPWPPTVDAVWVPCPSMSRGDRLSVVVFRGPYRAS
ncbi:hypothetical protein HanIR_Chr04g0187401 [Helianthus annuus]|nr:hypothetical protein HanIR_Chr04g0187401 [Helianthus annuus]